MSRFFTCHWKNKYWNPDCNAEFEPLRGAGSNSFTARGVAGGLGHIVYVVSLAEGRLYLGGRMHVSRIVPRKDAVRIRHEQGLSDAEERLFDAKEWVIDDEGGTPLHLRRQLDPAVTRQIKCILANGEERGLFFVPGTPRLDVQATRGVRELTAASAALLNRIIGLTNLPNHREMIVVTDDMLSEVRGGAEEDGV